MQVKEYKVKLLVSGDKTLRVTLDTIYPEDIERLSAMFAPKSEVQVEFTEED